MKFPVTIDRDEDGVWIAECPSIPGCVSQGQTRDEALKSIEEAIALCLEVRTHPGLRLVVNRKEFDKEYCAMVADKEREAEAHERCEALIGDVAHEMR